jgi:threonine synthase
MKTTAYEICEQLGWECPDWVVAPVGGGSLLLGLFLGFRDLHRAEIISRIPKLAAIQSDRCAPIVAAWKDGEGEASPAIPRGTVAEGIAVTRPVRGREVLAAIRASDGRAAVVGDEEIWAALGKLGRLGLFVEPTSAVVMAALSNLGRQEVIRRDQRVVLVLTGSGLKATDRIEVQWARGLSKG